MTGRVIRGLAAIGLVTLAFVPQAGAADGYTEVRERACEWVTISDDQVVHACGVVDAWASSESSMFTVGGSGTASAYVLEGGEVVRDETVVLQTIGAGLRVNGDRWGDRAIGESPVPGGPINGASRPGTVYPGGVVQGRLVFLIFLVQPDGTQVQLGDRHYAESDPLTLPPLP